MISENVLLREGRHEENFGGVVVRDCGRARVGR